MKSPLIAIYFTTESEVRLTPLRGVSQTVLSMTLVEPYQRAAKKVRALLNADDVWLLSTPPWEGGAVSLSVTRSKEALLPPADRRRRGPQPLLDRIERRSLGQHQNQPGAEDISGGQRAGLGTTAEFQLLVFAEHHGICRHTCLDVNKTSNVYSATGH